MISLDSRTYKETKQIALGQSKMSPMLAELAHWFLQTYSIKVLNFEFGKMAIPALDRYRLYVIVEGQVDYQKMFSQPSEPNAEYQDQIEKRFCDIALKYQFASKEQLKNLFVIYNDFSREAKTEANQDAASEVRAAVKQKYPFVWDVITMFWSSVVFYYTDEEVKANDRAGVNARIADDYYSILKKYDELNYFTRENMEIRFDSKENLDKNYEGNLFYYTR